MVRRGERLLVAALLLVLASGCGSTPGQDNAIATTPSPTASASTVAPSNVIANAVMARGVQSNTFEPVEITNEFPADQGVFHTVVTIANAPDNTVIRVAWLSADSQVSEFLLAARGSRNLDFPLRPEGGRLPPGNYQAEIYVNGKLDRTLNFSVQGIRAQQTIPATASVPSRTVVGVTMALDTQGANKDPVNPTTVFSPTAVIHAVVAIETAPPNTKFTATWYAVNVGTIVPPNTKIDSTDLTADKTRNLDFALSPTTTWPIGKYRVEISVNGKPDLAADYTV